MKLVLLKDDKRYGKKGDIITASDGFASNYLIPNKIATPATSTALNEAKQLKDSEQHKAQVLLQEAQDMAKKLNEAKVILPIKVGENGKVFGSITSKEIAQSLEQQGINLDKKKIDLPNPIKSTGVMQVKVKLHPQVVAKLTVEIKGEK